MDALLEHMVIAPGQGPTLRDKGLAELLGKQVEDTNTKAERNSIRLLLSQQPIEIICRLKTDESQKDNRGGRRYPSKLYPRDSVLAFLDACSPEYLGTDASDIHRKTDLKRLVIKAFDHFCQHMDTSPFRAQIKGERQVQTWWLNLYNTWTCSRQGED